MIYLFDIFQIQLLFQNIFRSWLNSSCDHNVWLEFAYSHVYLINRIHLLNSETKAHCTSLDIRSTPEHHWFVFKDALRKSIFAQRSLLSEEHHSWHTSYEWWSDVMHWTWGSWDSWVSWFQLRFHQKTWFCKAKWLCPTSAKSHFAETQSPVPAKAESRWALWCEDGWTICRSHFGSTLWRTWTSMNRSSTNLSSLKSFRICLYAWYCSDKILTRIV